MENAQDKKAGFEKKVAVLDSTHDHWLRQIMFFFGRRLTKMNNPLGRFIVKHITTKIAAWAIVKFKFLGVERSKKDMSAVDIAYEWLKPSTRFRCPVEVGEVSDERVVIYRPECTVGFCKSEQQPICRASMNMDMEIVRRLGGKLTVTETILEGARRCKHIIEIEKEKKS